MNGHNAGGQLTPCGRSPHICILVRVLHIGHPWEIWLLIQNPILESSCIAVKWVLALMW